MEFTNTLPFEEALFKIGDRSVIGPMLNSEQWSRVGTAMGEQAFFSSTVERVRFLQRSRSYPTSWRTIGSEVASISRRERKGVKAFAVGHLPNSIPRRRQYFLPSACMENPHKAQ